MASDGGGFSGWYHLCVDTLPHTEKLLSPTTPLELNADEPTTCPTALTVCVRPTNNITSGQPPPEHWVKEKPGSEVAFVIMYPEFKVTDIEHVLLVSTPPKLVVQQFRKVDLVKF